MKKLVRHKSLYFFLENQGFNLVSVAWVMEKNEAYFKELMDFTHEYEDYEKSQVLKIFSTLEMIGLQFYVKCISSTNSLPSFRVFPIMKKDNYSEIEYEEIFKGIGSRPSAEQLEDYNRIALEVTK